jgi:transposase
VLRSRIVLAAAAAQSDSAIANELAINRKTVTLWRARFAEDGLTSLWEIAPGRGRKPTYDSAKIKAIVDTTLQSKPKGMTHWSCRLMATRQGVSKSTVSTIWRSHNLKPHRVKRFKGGIWAPALVEIAKHARVRMILSGTPMPQSAVLWG